MPIINLIILSLIMSIDAFIICFINEVKNKSHYLLIPITFSFFQVSFLMLGYFLGDFIEEYLQNYIKYTTFIIFSSMGIKLIIDTLINKGKDKNDNSSLLLAILQAFTTSIDSLFLALPLAFVNINCHTLIIIVFLTTFIVCLLGLILRNKIKNNDEKISLTGAIILFIFAFKSLI